METAQSPIQTNETMDCPICCETIKKSAKICRFCNHNLLEYESEEKNAVEKEIAICRPAIFHSLGQIIWVLILGCFTLGIGAMICTFYYWLKSISTKYHITNHRIKIETGIFSKTKNNIEIFRIDDFDLRHPFLMRLMGYGILYIRSTDKNTPDFQIYGLKNIDSLYEELRECSMSERKRRNINVWAQS